MTRRFVPILIAGAAFIAMACSDSTAPSMGSARSIGVDAARASARNSPVGENATHVSITIPAEGGVVPVGPYYVVFPRRSVCVASAGYGERFWDKDCATRSGDVTIDAAYWEEKGDIYVEFLADLRFDPNKVVSLWGYSPVTSKKGHGADREIMFWSRNGNDKVRRNESKFDKSMRTYRFGDFVTRRVKHFSGYVISSGRSCDEGSQCDGGEGGT